MTDTLSPGHTVLRPAANSFTSPNYFLARMCLPGSLCSHNMSKPSDVPLLNDLLCISLLAVRVVPCICNILLLQLFSKCQDAFLQIFVEGICLVTNNIDQLSCFVER